MFVLQFYPNYYDATWNPNFLPEKSKISNEEDSKDFEL